MFRGIGIIQVAEGYRRRSRHGRGSSRIKIDSQVAGRQPLIPRIRLGSFQSNGVQEYKNLKEIPFASS